MTQANDIPNNVPGRAAEPIETEFLIVGTGPAGAALACFLGSHGKRLWRQHSLRKWQSL